MQLSPGTRLGTFQIVAKLGEGGMGEVYRAHDPKLGRDVAIKILPDVFVRDPQRMARFEREARTLASLNHPNVAQVFDFASTTAEAPGGAPTTYLVMELVEGDDLSVLTSRGAVPIPEAVAIAQQVAAGLGAAHELGIIHRDLKPANIKVRPDGTVKVLDFGLAKAMDPSASSASGSLANSPTITSPATELGVILGTAAYMSPEQARGKVVDRRADVWALGVVLYEMITGRRAFTGSEVSDVLAAVLKDPIDWSALPSETPASLRRLLRRCLEKDRTQRLDSMTAARLELSDVSSADASSTSVATGASSQAPSRRHALVGVALLAAGLAIGAFVAPRLWSASAPAAGRVVHFTVPGPERPTGVAITQQGDTIVYEGDKLYARAIDDAVARPIAGTEGARNLFLSPDGKWAGFLQAGKLKKVALTGGDALSLADVETDTPGGGWGPSNTVLYPTGWSSALYSVSADGGGTPKAVSTLDAAAGELGHWWPELLPDGKTVLFTIWTAGSGINDSRLGLLDLTTGKHRVLMTGAFGRYSKSGHIVYFHAGEYHVVPFNAATQNLSGDSRKIDLQILPQHPLGSRIKMLSLSADGTLVYLSGKPEQEDKLSWLSQDGTVEPLPVAPIAVYNADLSPDGRELLMTIGSSGTYQLYRFDLQRGTSSKIDLPGSNFSAIWNDKGGFFAFSTLRKGHFDSYLFRLDENREVPLITETLDQVVAAILNDGKRAIIEDYLADGSVVYKLANIDQPKDRKLLRLSGDVDMLSVSPDDQWLAVQVMTAGRAEVVVAPVNSPASSVRVSTSGGRTPVWSAKKPQLYYRRDEGIVAVSYSTPGGRFEAGQERLLTRLPKSYVIGEAPDGRLLIGTNVPGQESQIHAVLNWSGTIK